MATLLGGKPTKTEKSSSHALLRAAMPRGHLPHTRTSQHNGTRVVAGSCRCNLKPGLTNILLLDDEDDHILLLLRGVLVSSWPLLRSSNDYKEFLRRILAH